MKPKAHWSSRFTETRELALCGLRDRLDQVVEDFYNSTGVILPAPAFLTDVLEHFNCRSSTVSLSGTLLWQLELQYYAHPIRCDSTWNDFAVGVTEFAEQQVGIEVEWLRQVFRNDRRLPRLSVNSWAGGEPILEVIRCVEWSSSPRR